MDVHGETNGLGIFFFLFFFFCVGGGGGPTIYKVYFFFLKMTIWEYLALALNVDSRVDG